MFNTLKKKIKESFLSVFTITAVIILLSFILPNTAGEYLFDKQFFTEFFSFLFGAFLLIVGMTLYSLGSDMALSPIGETLGDKVTSTKKIPLILIVGFVIGFMVTIAEPDLIVLGNQLGDIKLLLIITIAIGVGLFLVIALLRTIFNINLNLLIIILYGLVFILAIFADNLYIPLSFDSGGVTTGSITVPFIMALGVGVASVLGGNKNENSFGVVAICSIGPIFFVLLLTTIFKPEINPTLSSGTSSFVVILLSCLKEVAIAISPITAFFIIANALFIKLPFNRLLRIIIGILYTFIGLTLFLTGVNYGFMPMGVSIGVRLSQFLDGKLLIPIGMIIGACLVLAEPAVHVLGKQVEEISNGNIKNKSLLFALSISMMISCGLAMLRVLTDISIWYIIAPGYFIAIILSFIVPKEYTAIAFDSGGVASGPMATTFMLPLVIGAAETLSGGNTTYILNNAYGLVAFIAMTPLLTIQIMGLIVKIKQSRTSLIPKIVLRYMDKNIVELNTTREDF